jgi:hypothetical protein
MVLGCCVVTLASHVSLPVSPNSHVFIDFHLLLSGSQVSCAFVAKFQAFVSITQNKKKENTFDIDCQIRWSPNSVFWLCLIVGFCLIITWIGNLLYLFIDPVPSYQQALDRVQAELD